MTRFGSASLAKTVWGEIGQDMAALAFDVLGTPGARTQWADYRLTSRSLTIAGGTTPDQQEHHRAARAGVAAQMNLELTDEQVALRDTVRRFLAERAPISGHVRPLLDDPTGTTDAVWRGLADLGTTGLLVPQEYGGAGMTMVEAGIVAEELGAALHPGPWLSTAVAATRALTRFGAEDAAAAKLLTGIADGTTIATVGPLDNARSRRSSRAPAATRPRCEVRSPFSTPPRPTSCWCSPRIPKAQDFSR